MNKLVFAIICTLLVVHISYTTATTVIIILFYKI